MADYLPSANMNLPVPIVGQDPGPDYATNVNTCLTVIDYHDHTPGYGVQITPQGLDINADLTFQNNNATNLRSSRYFAQSANLSGSDDIGCAYVVEDDLWYNDGNGTQIRITQSGGIAGSPGSIANLTSPASASYVSLSATFVWQSDTSTAANMDAGSYIFRNITANSKGLTLSPPTAMAADYTLVLPPIPVSQKIMTLDASGNMSAPYVIDNATLTISSNTIKVADSGIGTTQIANSAVTTAKIADGAVTPAKRSTAVYAISNTDSGSFTTTSTSFTNVLNSGLGVVTATYTSTGRPAIVVMNVADSAEGSMTAANGGSFRFAIDGVALSSMKIPTGTAINMPPSAFSTFISAPTAGSRAITCQVKGITGGVVAVTNCTIVVYEL